MLTKLVMLFIQIQCGNQPVEMQDLCVERVVACYERQIELTNYTPMEIAELCYGTYTDSL